MRTINDHPGYLAIANDVLTLVRQPRWGKDWKLPRTYLVGDKGEKRGMSYTIKKFVTGKKSQCVSMIVRFRGERNYTMLLIGDLDSFQEKIANL